MGVRWSERQVGHARVAGLPQLGVAQTVAAVADVSAAAAASTLLVAGMPAEEAASTTAVASLTIGRRISEDDR